MKRTYEQSLTFYKHNTKNRGFGRELYSTPKCLIYAIVSDLLKVHPYLKTYSWIDPCSGDGRWADVIKEFGIYCDSYDIFPLSNTVKQKNFLDSYEQNKFYIGNPPFSSVKKFVNHALSNNNICYFLGGSQLITGSLSTKAKLIHRFEGFEGNQRDKRSKVSFIDTLGNEVLVWCCGGLFDNNLYNTLCRSKEIKPNYFRTSTQCLCEITPRIREIKFERSVYEQIR